MLAVLTVVIDQLSKQWAVTNLADGREIPVIGDFISLLLTYNSGAAFSFLEGHTWVFTLVSAVVVVAMLFLVGRSTRPVINYSLAAIWGGALGNLLDRIFRDPGFPNGHVVDFINYNGWFIGNVADIALVVGVGVLVIAELVSPAEAGETPDTKQVAGEAE